MRAGIVLACVLVAGCASPTPVVLPSDPLSANPYFVCLTTEDFDNAGGRSWKEEPFKSKCPLIVDWKEQQDADNARRAEAAEKADEAAVVNAWHP